MVSVQKAMRPSFIIHPSYFLPFDAVGTGGGFGCLIGCFSLAHSFFRLYVCTAVGLDGGVSLRSFLRLNGAVTFGCWLLRGCAIQ